jgi:LPS export ABC transporter protein LptC
MKKSLVLVSVVFFAYLVWNAHQHTQPVLNRSSESSTRPDLYFSTFTLKQFDPSGAPALKISGETIQQIPGTESSLAKRAKVIYPEKTGDPWIMTADTMKMDWENEIMLLNENVSISNSQFEIMTEAVVWNHPMNQITSESDIFLKGKNWTHEARGITVSLERNFFTLHSQIRGQYEP